MGFMSKTPSPVSVPDLHADCRSGPYKARPSDLWTPSDQTWTPICVLGGMLKETHCALKQQHSPGQLGPVPAGSVRRWNVLFLLSSHWIHYQIWGDIPPPYYPTRRQSMDGTRAKSQSVNVIRNRMFQLHTWEVRVSQRPDWDCRAELIFNTQLLHPFLHRLASKPAQTGEQGTVWLVVM